MNNWKQYISSAMFSFKKKKGWHIFSSSIIVKLLNFGLILFAVRMLPASHFGDFSYAQSVIAFVLPLAGLGLNHALLRYGSILKNQEDKRAMFAKTWPIGLVCAFGLALLIIILSGFITNKLPGAKLLLIILSGQVVSTFLLEMVKSLFRIYDQNKTYALIEIQFAVLLFVLAMLGMTFLGIQGLCYAYVLSGTTLFVYWFFKRNNMAQAPEKTGFVFPTGYLKYGIYASIGGVASALMYQVDVLTIGNLLGDEVEVAIYKVATHLPYSVIFLSLAFVHAQYVTLAKNYKNKQVLNEFLKQYYAIFIPFGLIMYAVVYVGAPFLIELFYGQEYMDAVKPLRILFLGLLAIFWLRVPFGNLLGAVGKSNWNAIIAGVMIVGNVLLNVLLVTRFGLIGAAWATTLLLTISGTVSLWCYVYYLRKN